MGEAVEEVKTKALWKEAEASNVLEFADKDENRDTEE